MTENFKSMLDWLRSVTPEVTRNLEEWQLADKLAEYYELKAASDAAYEHSRRFQDTDYDKWKACVTHSYTLMIDAVIIMRELPEIMQAEIKGEALADMYEAFVHNLNNECNGRKP